MARCQGKVFQQHRIDGRDKIMLAILAAHFASYNARTYG